MAELNNIFYEAVRLGNVRQVHIMMKDSLLADLTFGLFSEMEKAARNLDGLYVDHDGRSFNLDKGTWDDEYMNKMMVQVISNFSHERVDHLKEVVRYLRPVEVKKQSRSTDDIIQKSSSHTGSAERDTFNHSGNNQQKFTDYQEGKRRDQEEGIYRGAKIAAGAVAGAVAGGVVASVVSSTVVIGAAVGAVAGAAVTYVVTNGGD